MGMEDPAALARLHERVDSLIATLSELSQRTARIEVQVGRVVDNAKDIERLESKTEKLGERISTIDLKIVEAQKPGSGVVIDNRSKARDYAEKGGLVAATGIIIEILRWVVEIAKSG